jgi:YidC/Oxa1 family membrane protein insertase
MNKRALIFVLLFTASLFVVNAWISSSKSKKSNAYVEEQKQIKNEEQQELTTRIETLSSLPIAKLYSDSEGAHEEALAIEVGHQYLLLSSSDEPLKTLFIKINDAYAELDLRVSADKKMQPILYSSNPEEKLIVAKPPLVGNIDVQILEYHEGEKNVNVTLGELENGNIYFPIEKPKEDGIVLIRTKKGYLPYAVYSAEKNSVKALEDYPQFQNVLSIETEISPALTIEDQEKFYVIENEYQQLVFSNLGGALAEINLALKGELHPASAIRPIRFDRILEQDYPSNDHFPAFPYFKADPQTGQIVEFNERPLGGYYPLLRRSIIGYGENSPTYRIPPQYYACNVLSADLSTANAVYQLKRLEQNLIEFEAVFPNRRIIKTYSFSNSERAPYCIDLKVKIEGDARGLFITSGIPEVELISGSFSPTLKYRITKNKKPSVEKLSLPKPTSSSTTIAPDWVCNSNGFLGIIIDPLTEIGAGYTTEKVEGEIVPTRLSLVDSQYNRYPLSKYPGYQLQLPLRSPNKTIDFRLFAGPFDTEILHKVDLAFTDPATGYNPSYTSAQSYHGWFSFISEPFAKFLFWLMNLFYTFTHSWGFSIILLTIALRIMMYPLNNWSIKSSLKMQAVAPEVAAIQARHKKDPKKAQLEVMTLYRERGVNPLTGCFPILIQMPFLIGMFDLLKSAFELRGAKFIPGWIDNLTAPDILFSWSYPIPFFGTSFHLLPFLLGAVMYFQQRMSTALPKDVKLMTDQQRQQKTMGNIMVIIFTVMFYHFPSGLNIYWLSSMLLGILQQSMTSKRFKKRPTILKIRK